MKTSTAVEQRESELSIELQCNSIAVREICDDNTDWTDEGVVSIGDEEISEITRGDEKPFFVEIIPIYEGLSGNNKYYTVDAVKSSLDAVIGVNMYKGHVEPGTQGWKYREPVGRIVAARLGTIEIEGKKVTCAKAKAYICTEQKKLKSDIRRGMAGNVSILGNARSVREINDSVSKVIKIHAPLTSVDFCNPGTGGMPHAKVVSVVAEMVRKIEPEKEEENMTVRLTKEELLTEYKAEVASLVGEQVEEQIREIATARREVAEQKEQIKDKQKETDTQIAEMKSENETLKSENDRLQKQLNEERNARITAELTTYADTYISEMKGLDGTNPKIIDLASKEVTPTVVDGDLEKSKVAYRDSIKTSIEKLTAIAEMFDKSSDDADGDDDSHKTRKHSNNPKKKAGDLMSRVLSSDLIEARKKRAPSAVTS